MDDCKYETDVAFPLQFIGSKKARKKSRARGNSSLDVEVTSRYGGLRQPWIPI